MKRISVVLLAFFAAALYVPQYMEAQTGETYRQEGIASWYGPEFDGRPTASGEVFNSSLLTAAHPTLPFGTMLTVTNRHNNKQITVRVNDRGPFVSARIIDISKAAAEQLDMIVTGTAPVMIESIERIAASGSGRAPQPAASQAAVPQTAVDSYWTFPPDSVVAESVSTVSVSAVPAVPVTTTPVPVPEPVYNQQPVPQIQNPAPVYNPPPAQPVYNQQPAPQIQNLAPVYSPPATVYPQQQIQPIIIYAGPPPAISVPQASVKPAGIGAVPNKTYRIQVGAYRIPKNAVEAFEKLKNAGLNPAYERNGEYFRVVLAGVPGIEVSSISERLGTAGFTDTLIREEH